MGIDAADQHREADEAQPGMGQPDGRWASAFEERENPREYPLPSWRPEQESWPGEVVTDGFRWLENAQDPEVMAWVDRENRYTDDYFERQTPGRVRRRIEYLRVKSGHTSYGHVTPIDGGYVACACKDNEHEVVRLDERFANPVRLFCARDAGEPCKAYWGVPCPADPTIVACTVLFDRAPRLSVLVRDTKVGVTLARLDGMFSWSWDASGEHLYYSDAEEHPESGTNDNFVRRWVRTSGEVQTVCAIRENAVYCDVQPDALGGLFAMVNPDYGTQIVYHLDADALAQVGNASGTGTTDGEGGADSTRSAGATDATGTHDAQTPAAVLVNPGVTAAFAYVGTLAGRHLLLTNWEAPLGRIISVDAKRPSLDDAREVIASEPATCEPAGAAGAADATGAIDAEPAAGASGTSATPVSGDVPAPGVRLLTGAAVVGDAILCAYQHEGASELELRAADGSLIRAVELPDTPGNLYAEGSLAPYGCGDAGICLDFESFRVPPSVVRYDPATGKLATLFTTGDAEKPADPAPAEASQAHGTSAADDPADTNAAAAPQTGEPAPAPHAPAKTPNPIAEHSLQLDIVVERIDVPARDGATLSAYLVRRRDVRPTGKIPTLFYGYGGYNNVLAPDFTNKFIGLDVSDWAMRRGLYVHCILRGGGERGPRWHEAGMLANKPNVFHDFIDIVAHVQELGWTSPEHSALCGGSNGGLLVTAALTQAPDLVRCVVASVPHTDMLRFVHDDRGPMYITEYGDPRDPALFETMRDYSPYHNVEPGRTYPALLVQTGELDNNVPPYHGKKFAARMQAEASSKHPVLLRVLARGAHDRGEGGIYYATVAEMQCFIEHELGMDAY